MWDDEQHFARSYCHLSMQCIIAARCLSSVIPSTFLELCSNDIKRYIIWLCAWICSVLKLWTASIEYLTFLQLVSTFLAHLTLSTLPKHLSEYLEWTYGSERSVWINVGSVPHYCLLPTIYVPNTEAFSNLF